MASLKILREIESAARVITRLDYRIFYSPVAEIWQVRACIMAAEKLSSVDGTPTTSADVASLLTGAKLPTQEAYLNAAAGFAHWRRCMARLKLTERTSRLVGRSVSASRAIAERLEDQKTMRSFPKTTAKWHDEYTGFRPIDIDDYAFDVGSRALGIMRGYDDAGADLLNVAKGIQTAVRMNPDPDYFDRVERFRAGINSEIDAVYPPPLPSPADGDEEVDRELPTNLKGEALKDAIRWGPKPHLGSCYAVIPDCLKEMGFTQTRLSCLTGATRRLGFDGRAEDTAISGFLRQITEDAWDGLRLLDRIEMAVAQFASAPLMNVTSRSLLPEIVHAFLILPAVDASWLRDALEMSERVVQKSVRQLADAGLLVAWGSRMADTSYDNSRETSLWMIASFQDEYRAALALPDMRRITRMTPIIPDIDPAALLERFRTSDADVPMSIIFQRFEEQIRDIDRDYQSIFGRIVAKREAARKPPTAPK